MIATILALTIIHTDGTVESSNEQIKGHYSSDQNGGYYYRDNQGNKGHLRKNFGGDGYTYTQRKDGVTVIKQKNER